MDFVTLVCLSMEGEKTQTSAVKTGERLCRICEKWYGGEDDQTDPRRNPVEDHQCIAFGCPDPDTTLLGGGGLVRILHRRTLLVPVGAEHAAITALRFHGDTARAALVEVDAVVGGHRLTRIVVYRTGT